MAEELDLTRMGLSTEEVEASRKQHGSNRLTPPQRPSALKLYLEKFKDPIILILLFAAVLSLCLGFVENDYLETIGILVAVLLATGIGFYFEWDAARKFDVLSALSQEELVTLVRGGHVVQLPRSELVVGDVILLQPGEEIPADGRLLQAVNMTINESSLTGELIAAKTTDPERMDKEATYPSNMVMRSTTVVEGNGLMTVTAVGDSTEIGHVAKEAARPTDIETPLKKQLNRLASVITKVTFAISILVFVLFSAHAVYDYFTTLPIGVTADWFKVSEMVLRYFMLAVTLIVMAVPEGLPMAISLSLALNMRRMLKTNNLVRHSHACETMGAVTVICTDKTGTLTQNVMAVADIQFDAKDEALVFENFAVNSTAHLDEEGRSLGNHTEGALLQYLKGHGEDYAEWRRKTNVISQLAFSTERKFMASLVRSTVNGKMLLYVKGAPETVMSFCRLDEAECNALQCRLQSYQQKAMRTLAFAYREVADKDISSPIETLVSGLNFLGVTAIADPIREEVPASVAACKSAGIKVKIVTGDNAGTAIEIARQIGFWTDEDTCENTITGTEFAALSDDEVLKRLAQIKVMSRARPLDKQRLVRLLQRQGEVVAVTGDGTNDAPALHHAQVGLSMGTGTSVAKNASDITLLDDSFRSIATAVLWGRSLYKNIQRFIVFQLTVSLAAMLICIAGSIFGTEMPLTVTQILWINLIMDTFASLAISTLPPDAAVMKEKPRRQKAFIITRSMAVIILVSGVLFSLALFGILFYFHSYQLGGSFSPDEMTIFFTIFVMMQFWNLLNVKTIGSGESAFSHLNRCSWLLLVMAVILVAQIVIVQFGGQIFRTQPLNIQNWLVIIGLSSLVLWIGELTRGIGRIFKNQ